jgi:transposase
MGGESEAAWRGVLDDLISRRLKRPGFLIIDGAAGLEKALAALWPEVPTQRCTVHKHRNLLAHAPEAPGQIQSAVDIGRINLATLLAEVSGPLSRRDYPALPPLSGVAPVTKRSGKSCIVVMRYAAHVRLRNTVYHWARVAIQHDPRSRSRYTALRQRGHSHGRAIRGVADRLLNVACVLLQRQTTFDPDHGQPAAA